MATSVREAATISILNQLNPSQRSAAEKLTGPVMIIAGAGSGKTRVLTYRIAHLIQSGIRPDTILALTFTNKAANEMKSRITKLVGESSRHIWAGTFHSIFARVLRIECEHIGYNRNFSIYDTDDSIALIRTIMNTMKLPLQEVSPSVIHSRITAAKNTMLSPREYKKQVIDSDGERTALVYDQYQRQLKKNNAFDFDDLLLKPLDLFTRRPDILDRYQYRFNYILVDEYQDTNRVQCLLIKELARRHGNICVVGDDAQSIYSFRGADIRNILEFERDYPDCSVFRLEQNYRSTKTILSAANSLILNNVDQIPKRLWTENVDGEPVVLERCIDDRDEASRIVARLEEESKRQKLDLRDFAVLYRTNAQSRSIEDALRRSGIPYTIVGSVAFYKRKEIKDILAYLNLVANPHDDGSLLRIINVPARGIGATTVSKLISRGAREGTSLFDLLDSKDLEKTLPGRTCRTLSDFSAMMRKYIGLKGSMSLSELARSLVDETGILPRLKEENTPESLARRENIQELVSALTEFSEHNDGATLEGFLEEVALVSDVDTADFERNAVTLMTLHAAKGLEFSVVFLTGLEEGIFPLSSSLSNRADLEEERRLMYVGMTRAKRNLYLMFAGQRHRFGERSFMVRSRFIDEIDPQYLRSDEVRERRAITGRWRDRTELRVAQVPPMTPAGQDQEGAEPFPMYEDESQEMIQPKVGLRVVHASFGRGRIVALHGDGENTRAVVDFETVGKKHLMIKFARLRPV